MQGVVMPSAKNTGYVPGQILVIFRAGVDVGTCGQFLGVRHLKILNRMPRIRTYLVAVTEGKEKYWIDKLGKHDFISSVGPNRTVPLPGPARPRLRTAQCSVKHTGKPR